MIVGAIFFFLAGIVGSVWWAATVSEKLSTIVIQQASIVSQQNTFRDAFSQSVTMITGRLSDLEGWRKMVDIEGDPAGKVRDEALAKQINDLRHDFDVMQARLKP